MKYLGLAGLLLALLIGAWLYLSSTRPAFPNRPACGGDSVGTNPDGARLVDSAIERAQRKRWDVREQ